MIRYLPLVVVLLASTAHAQQASSPAPQDLIAALHTQLWQATDQLTMVNATLLHEQQQIASLQAQLQAAEAKLPPVQGKSSGR